MRRTVRAVLGLLALAAMTGALPASSAQAAVPPDPIWMYYNLPDQDAATEIRLQDGVGEPQFKMINGGTSDTGEAKNVVMTLDLSGLPSAVKVTGVDDRCTISGATVRCALGDIIAAIQSVEFKPFRLVATGQPVGPLGSIEGRVSCTGCVGDAHRSIPVWVTAPGPDLQLYVDQRGFQNGRSSLIVGARNYGDAPSRFKQVVMRVPAGVAIGDLNPNPACAYDGGTAQGATRLGPFTMTCSVDVTVAPYQSLSLQAAAGSGAPDRFFATFPASTPGPAELKVSVEAVVDGAEARPADNTQTLVLTTPANKLDARLSAKTVRQGDTATVTWTLLNAGPSDTTGHTLTVVAPSGTEVLPTEGCTVSADKKRLTCVVKEPLAAKATATGTVRLHIVGTPGRGGSITVAGTGPSADTTTANNKAAITVPTTSTATTSPTATAAPTATTTPGNDGTSLPITGPGSGLLSAGTLLLLLGTATLFLTRRRSA
ncbi:hypothetical protein ACTOB_008144 [Actinoplanes oblitus]|uniref:DUF11 domain-containing protein n=1 Tax=Actinoplanes oblitus TaxID=3040509 RepID=A0ABY8WDV9_9ACTN|nr:hypothetical protein [Actinoplanes oblitus]WIM95995.1 hypothetical protein ACTOB_008144 [Actinoplanes oblitus]